MADVEEVWQPFAARFAALARGELPATDAPCAAACRCSAADGEPTDARAAAWPGTASPTATGRARRASLGPDGLGLWDADTAGARRRRRRRAARRAVPGRRPRPGAAPAAPAGRGRTRAPATTVAARDALRADPALRRRLVAVLGASRRSATTWWPTRRSGRRWPPGRTGSRRPPTAALATPPGRPSTGAAGCGGVPAALLRIAAADLTGGRDVEQTMAALSALADATLAAALRDRRRRAARGHAAPRLAVIAMGKCGGGELNYVSDVDVIFVAAADDDLAAGTAVAARLMQICGQVAWPVDAALRPEGSRGPLVRTLASHLAYYRRWARTWEFQALLKARPAAGDLALGAASGSTSCRRWSGTRPSARRRSRTSGRCAGGSSTTCRRSELDREIKRGPGGLRDIEFAVQLLQLVHGRGDESLRAPATIAALRGAGRRRVRRPRRRRGAAARRTGSCAPSSTGCSCSACAAPTPCPTDPGARCAGWPTRWATGRRRAATPSRRSAPSGSRHAQRGAPAARQAALPAAAGGGGPGAGRGAAADPGGGPAPAGDARLRRPGRRAAPPGGADRRRVPVPPRSSARCCRCCSSEFADAPEPDRGLLAYRQVSDTLGSTPWYLRLLRDEGPVALRLARLLGLSRYVDRPAGPRPGGAAAARRRRRADPAPARVAGGRASPPRPTGTSSDRGGAAARSRGASARCAAGSCSGSPAPTCSAGPVAARRRPTAGSTWSRSARRSPTSPTPRSARRCAPPVPRARPPGCRSPSSAWAGSAGPR